MMNFPQKFEEKMRGLLGGEFDEFAGSFALPRYYGIRANTLKIRAGELVGLVKTELTPVPWCGDGFYYDYDAENRLSKSPYYAAGLYYLQEPSAMSAAGILDIEPGERVLDLCAAPGGKTAQAAAKLQNAGVLVTNDLNSKRIAPLMANVQLMGIRNALITNDSAERLAAVFPHYFDKIIVDAPCSGEGMFRKDGDAMLAWDAGKSGRLNTIQMELLEYAAAMLRVGGVIGYSTCTFAPEENEVLIKAFLDKHKDFALKRVDHDKYGLSPGRGEWAGDAALNGTARVWPHVQRGEGHFIAQLQRVEGDNDDDFRAAKYPKAEGVKAYQEFAAEYLANAPEGEILRHKDVLLLPPQGLPELGGVRIVRSGLILGAVRRGRFEPSRALALALKKDNCKNVIDLTEDSSDLQRFLRGESFDIAARDGYNLLCVGGYPINFVKVLNGRLKWRAG